MQYAEGTIASAGSHARLAPPRLAARLLRVHQWVKNVLVFVPAVGAHRLDALPVGQSVAAFTAFSLCASSAYVVNDLLDLEHDRRNPAKAHRPLAAGHVHPRTALPVAVIALASGLGLGAALLPGAFVALLAGYWAATLAYSLWLKRVEMLDVILLAGLYVARVLGGTLATGIPTSSWLFTFAIFLFLSLALVKRSSELLAARERAGAAASGRGYRDQDLDVLSHLGTAAGFLAVLVLALYINHPDVTRLYPHHERLWLLCPLGLYWIGRVWLLARRGGVHEDPVVFALCDRPSYVVGALGLLVVFAAS